MHSTYLPMNETIPADHGSVESHAESLYVDCINKWKDKFICRPKRAEHRNWLEELFFLFSPSFLKDEAEEPA